MFSHVMLGADDLDAAKDILLNNGASIVAEIGTLTDPGDKAVEVS